MPTDYGDDESLVSYVCTCAKITALYQACVPTRAVVLDDFNIVSLLHDSLTYSKRLPLICIF